MKARDTYVRSEVWVRKRFIGSHSLLRVEGLTTKAVALKLKPTIEHKRLRGLTRVLLRKSTASTEA